MKENKEFGYTVLSPLMANPQKAGIYAYAYDVMFCSAPHCCSFDMIPLGGILGDARFLRLNPVTVHNRVPEGLYIYIYM